MITHFSEWAGITTILASLEINLSIVCACVPLLQPLINTLSERLKTRYRSGSNPLKHALANPFCSRHRKRDRGSTKLNVFADKHVISAMNQKPESTNLQRVHDKLYPISTTDLTLSSLDEDIRPNDGAGRTHVWIDTASHSNGEGSYKLEKIVGGT